MDSVASEFDTLTASNTTETLRPRSNIQELPVLQQVESIPDIPQPLSSQSEQTLNDPAHPNSELVIDDQPPHKAITVGELKQREQSELDKVEAAALNVVHQIEEKMAIVEEKIVTEVKAVEGVLVEATRKTIHVHLPAGGGSVIKNPG